MSEVNNNHNTPRIDSQLSEAWGEAMQRMFDAAPMHEYDTVLYVTTTDNPDFVAEFRKEFHDRLTPESSFFLEMSEAAKRAKAEKAHPVDI